MTTMLPPYTTYVSTGPRPPRPPWFVLLALVVACAYVAEVL